VRVAAASLELPTDLAASGERKDEDESKARDWQFVALGLKVRAEGELGVLDLSPRDLRLILASLASIWLYMEASTAGLRWGRPWPFITRRDKEASVIMLQKTERAAVRSASERTLNPASMVRPSK